MRRRNGIVYWKPAPRICKQLMFQFQSHRAEWRQIAEDARLAVISCDGLIDKGKFKRVLSCDEGVCGRYACSSCAIDMMKKFRRRRNSVNDS